MQTVKLKFFWLKKYSHRKLYFDDKNLCKDIYNYKDGFEK